MSSNKEKYIQLINQDMEQVQELIMKAQDELCKKLNVTEQMLQDSEMLLMERGLGNHLFMLQASVLQKLKDKLPKKNQVDTKQTKEIINYQITLLNNKPEQFKPYIEKLPNSFEMAQIIPTILNVIISDMIYNEYNIEEEDYMPNIADSKQFKESEVQELMKGIEQGVYTILNQNGLLPKQLPGMGMGMGMGGFPGMF